MLFFKTKEEKQFLKDLRSFFVHSLNEKNPSLLDFSVNHHNAVKLKKLFEKHLGKNDCVQFVPCPEYDFMGDIGYSFKLEIKLDDNLSFIAQIFDREGFYYSDNNRFAKVKISKNPLFLKIVSELGSVLSDFVKKIEMKTDLAKPLINIPKDLDNPPKELQMK